MIISLIPGRTLLNECFREVLASLHDVLLFFVGLSHQSSIENILNLKGRCLTTLVQHENAGGLQFEMLCPGF